MVNLTQNYFTNQTSTNQQVSGVQAAAAGPSGETTTASTSATQPKATTTTTAAPAAASVNQTVPSVNINSSASQPPPQPNRILNFPAVRFLLRTDFFNQLHLNDEALMQYNGSQSLKHMVTKIRREGQQTPPITASFERYQHMRDLVSLINKFAETNKPLPQG